MKYLIVTIDGGGNLPPVFNLTRKLVKDNHTVSILGEPWLKELVENAGAKFFPFKEYFTKTDRKKDIFEDWKNKNNSFENVIFGPMEVVVKETMANMAANNTDVLIVDMVLPAGLIAGEAMKIPSVCIFHMPEYLPARNRPPGGLGLIPGQGTLGKMRDRLLGKVFELVFNKYLTKLNRIRKSLNLPKVKNVTDIFRNADLRLIMTSKAFDFPIEPLPANVKYVGPVLDDPDWVSPWQNPWPSNDKRPLVVVGLSSTFQNQRQVITNCIEALGKLDVRGLVTLGLAMENEKFTTPQNVIVTEGASHAKIFPYADIVITHAGHGTVMRALANGIPLVCLPMGRDQGDNAAKVVYHKAGIKLPAKSDPEKIANAVKKVLNDTNYKKNARLIGDKILEDSNNGNIVLELKKLTQKSG
jgi:MGT family glycosyltransferase